MNNPLINFNFSTKQQDVFDAAFSRLKSERWFEGVCVDNFPTTEECENNFQESVAAVVFETSMWSDPDFFNWDKNNS